MSDRRTHRRRTRATEEIAAINDELEDSYVDGFADGYAAAYRDIEDPESP